MMEKLAIDGGKPVRTEPFPPRIMFDEREKKAALEVIEKTMTGNQALDRYGGVHVDAYEKEVAAYFGTKFATATSAGTAAIHAALGALRLEPGTEVITSPITDPGTVAPILMQNCIPIFADVDYDTLNITAETIAERLSEKTRVIIPVHLAGQPCDMDPIMKLAREHNLIVIEDVAQAHGAKYKGRFAGSIGDMGTLSLMSGKHMTSGGQGGMVLTDNEEFYWNAKRFADRGKPFGSSEPTNLFLGLNYRMTELEAAIGRVQLTKLADIVAKRRKTAESLRNAMQGLQAFRLWKIRDDVDATYWFLFLHFDSSKMKVSKVQCAAALQAEGMPVGAHYVTVMYKQKWIRDQVTYGGSRCPWSCPHARKIDHYDPCPQAEKALADYMTLYMHEGWGEREVEDVVQALQKVEHHYLK